MGTYDFRLYYLSYYIDYYEKDQKPYCEPCISCDKGDYRPWHKHSAYSKNGEHINEGANQSHCKGVFCP